MASKPRSSLPLQALLICCFALLLVSGAHPVAAARSPAAAPVTPAPTTHKWNVEYIMWAPDCKQRVMVGINGMFPGPNITAKAGDEIVVEVTNHLHTEGVVIHWHGIRQIGTPWADGTASISQCPINPGETFTYRFKADKPGTFFYHGHFGMQRAAGLYGSLIVKPAEKEPFVDKHPYEDEDGEPMSMLLSDWWHESVYAQAAGLDGKGKHWQWVGEPQTLLINGRGQFVCSLGRSDGACDRNKDYKRPCDGEGKDDRKQTTEEKARCEEIRRSECGPFCEDSQCSPVVFRVHPGKTYRLRIASTTSLSALNVQVQGHTMTLVEADGNFVEPLEEQEGIDIYSGESYSVLLNRKPDEETAQSHAYWITVRTIGRKHRTPPALGILRYTDDDGAWPAGPPPETPFNLPDEEEEKQVKKEVSHSKDFAKKIKAWKPPEGYSAPPELEAANPDRVITLLNTQNRLEDGDIKWAINHVSLSLPATPYLGAYFYGIAGSVFDDSAEPPATYDSSRYDIEKPSDAQAPGAQPPPLSISDRVFRIAGGAVVDVVLQNANMLQEGVSEPHPWHLHGHEFWVLGYGEGRYDAATAQLNMEDPPLRNTVVLFPGGWAKIRFVADNPGVWAFHCHIEPHLHMGMGVIFAEGTEKLRGLNSKAKEAFTCGKAVKAALDLTPAAVPPPPRP
ncbi:hypothetical protein BS78_10G170400 [Paspalum vaginatum]|nr:hypothetical protein BS78_10G170400 [Paspalum vaginatum]